MKKIIVLFLSLIICSCGLSDTKEKIWTTSLDGKYFSNEKFKLTISKPENWYSLDSKELAQVMIRGKEVAFSGGEENLEILAEHALKSVTPLFSFYEFPPGQPASFNISLSSVAENISNKPGIKTGCDYLFHSKQVMKQIQIKMDFENECYIQDFNGIGISYFNTKTLVGDKTIKQTYMACISEGYAIGFVKTFINDEGEEKINKILNTLEVPCMPYEEIDINKILGEEICRGITQNSKTVGFIDKEDGLRKIYVSNHSKGMHYKKYNKYWQDKVEQVGSDNYPVELKENKIEGTLMLAVDINIDGTIRNIDVSKPSENNLINAAAKDIVKLAEPFLPLPECIRKEVQVIRLLRVWKFTNDE